MVNQKATKLSDEQKAEIKDIVEGAYDIKTLQINVSGVHSKKDLDAIVKVLKEGKAYVFAGKTSRNTSYNIRKRLSAEYKLDNVKFGWIKPSGQSVIYLA